MRSWINSAEFVMVCIFSFDSFKVWIIKKQMTLKKGTLNSLETLLDKGFQNKFN
jgi:hypothetical protein